MDYPKKATGNIEVDSDPDGLFNYRWATDANFRRDYANKVADRQRQLPEWLQREIQGQTLGETPGQGVDLYNAYIRRRLADNKQMLRSEWSRLPLAEQDRLEQDGWRSLDVDNSEGRVNLRAAEGMDPYTAMEYAQTFRARAQRSPFRP